jgi:hypothetical protein
MKQLSHIILLIGASGYGLVQLSLIFTDLFHNNSGTWVMLLFTNYPIGLLLIAFLILLISRTKQPALELLKPVDIVDKLSVIAIGIWGTPLFLLCVHIVIETAKKLTVAF